MRNNEQPQLFSLPPLVFLSSLCLCISHLSFLLSSPLALRSRFSCRQKRKRKYPRQDLPPLFCLCNHHRLHSILFSLPPPWPLSCKLQEEHEGGEGRNQQTLKMTNDSLFPVQANATVTLHPPPST